MAYKYNPFSGSFDFYMTSTWGDIGGTQSDVNLSGFNNDIPFLTYWDSISFADSASYATNADYAYSCNYAYSADYASTSSYCDDFSMSWCYYDAPADGTTYARLNNTWSAVTGDTTFTEWRGGTTFQPTGSCQFDDDATTPTKYARYWDVPNSKLAEWWDGTNTFTMGSANGLNYVAGGSDVIGGIGNTEQFGTSLSYVYTFDAGTSDCPHAFRNIKDSTDTIIPIGAWIRDTTGTAADGIGGSHNIYILNDSAQTIEMIEIDYVTTDVSTGTESCDYIIKQMVAGTLTEALKLTGGKIAYAPTTASDWASTPPTTIQEALDRIAAVLTANSLQP